MWEILSLGDRPYAMLSDEAVLQGVVLDRMLLPQDIDTRMPFKEDLWVDSLQFKNLIYMKTKWYHIPMVSNP